MLTPCCNAYSTIVEGTLCCKVCFEELPTNYEETPLVEVKDCPICGCIFDTFIGCLVCEDLEKE